MTMRTTRSLMSDHHDMNTTRFTLDEIHDEDFEAKVRRLMDRDIARLLERRTEFTEVCCPACLSRDTAFELEHLGFSYKRCADCDLLFISPGPTNAHTLWFLEHSEGLRIWREEMPDSVRERRSPMYRERAAYILDSARLHGSGTGSILEIGAGNGELALALLDLAPDALDRIVLCEPQPITIKHPKISVVQDAALEGNVVGGFDLVVSFEVLEHIPDPTDFLTGARKLLTDDGLLILSTPNEKSLEMRVLKTLSSNIPFDHVRFYNPHALTILLERFGFEVLMIETPGRLDVEMIQRRFEAGELDLDTHPVLRFFLEEGYELKDRLQAFLRRENLSSHMRVIARRRKNSSSA